MIKSQYSKYGNLQVHTKLLALELGQELNYQQHTYFACEQYKNNNVYCLKCAIQKIAPFL